MQKIDLDLLKPIDHGHMFFRVSDQVENTLRKKPAILDRVFNALEFSRLISGDHEECFRGGLVRAALTELVSIEDVHASLRSTGALSSPRRMLWSTGDPLLCLVREIRNLEVHVSTASLSSERRDLLWGNKDNPGTATPVNHAIHFIDNLSLASFQDLRNYSKYDPVEFCAALKWFDEIQHDWGISEILYLAITRFADELASDIECGQYKPHTFSI